MTMATESNAHRSDDERGLVFAAVAGLFFFVALLKFGNPVVLDSLVAPPQNWLEALYQLWPLKWAYIGLAPVIVVGLFCISIKPFTLLPRWMKYASALPLAWLLWQCISATQSIDPKLSWTTVMHFAACVACFYLGLFALGRCRNPWPLWLFLLLALIWIVRVGWEQHFGGLEMTRKYFYAYTDWQKAPPEFIKKLSSDRIYSTLFYPNTLAGVLLILIPISAMFVWRITGAMQRASRLVVITLVVVPAIACLWWSGSRIALAIAALLVGAAMIKYRSNRLVILGIVLATSVSIGFLAGYSLVRHPQTTRERGTSSLSARFDYWKAAAQIGVRRLATGIGPATFGTEYAKVKPSDAEMTKLVHNDYLEQFCDSGAMGFLLFSGFFTSLLLFLYRYSSKTVPFVAISLVAIILHSTVEFHLYIPAVAWLTFLLAGWTIAQQPALKPTEQPG